MLRFKSGCVDGGGSGYTVSMAAPARCPLSSALANLEGILSPTVQQFLDHMADCSKEKSEKIDRLAAIYPRIAELDIADCMSDNVTVSTMH